MVRRGIRQAGVVLAVVAAMVLVVSPMVAVAASVQAYAVWTVQGANPSWNGTTAVANVAGLPAATFTTNSLTPEVVGGASNWLGPSTPFGEVFGSSQNKQYLSVANTTSQAPSTTTLTFASPTPLQVAGSGWGFALGDVDADTVRVTATAVGGGALTAAQLGWQSSFNYCNVSPKPGGCPVGVSTDEPVWDPSTQTLVGNGSDTGGAAGWFRPTVAVETLTLEFTRLTGFPNFQLWIAAAGDLQVAGTVVQSIDGTVTGPVAGAEVALLDGQGDPVTVAGVPLTATTGPDGTYVFDGLTPRADYQVQVVRDTDTVTVDADASAGSVEGLTVVFNQVTPTTTTTSTSTSTTTTSTTIPTTTTTVPATTTTVNPAPTTPTTAAPPRPATSIVPAGANHRSGLPATGAGLGGLLAVGVPMVATGATLVATARRRHRSN